MENSYKRTLWKDEMNELHLAKGDSLLPILYWVSSFPY